MDAASFEAALRASGIALTAAYYPLLFVLLARRVSNVQGVKTIAIADAACVLYPDRERRDAAFGSLHTGALMIAELRNEFAVRFTLAVSPERL